MLAQRLPGVLPPMDEDEAIEAAAVASIEGRFDPRGFHRRPFRSPHHSASAAALVGGGCEFHKYTGLHKIKANGHSQPSFV